MGRLCKDISVLKEDGVAIAEEGFERRLQLDGLPRANVHQRQFSCCADIVEIANFAFLCYGIQSATGRVFGIEKHPFRLNATVYWVEHLQVDSVLFR